MFLPPHYGCPSCGATPCRCNGRTTDPMPEPEFRTGYYAPPPAPRCPSPRCKDEDTMDRVKGKLAWRCWRCSAEVPDRPQVAPSVKADRP